MWPRAIPRHFGQRKSHPCCHGGSSAEETGERDTPRIHYDAMGYDQTVLAGRLEGTTGCGGYPFLSERCSAFLADEPTAERPESYHHVVWGLPVIVCFFSLVSPKMHCL